MKINDSQGVDGYQDYYPFEKILPGRSYTSGNIYDDYKTCPPTGAMQVRMYDPEIGWFLGV